MDTSRFTRVDAITWRIEPHGAMRVPAIIYADENLIREMDDKVYEQAANVATLPGIVQASYAMPDAHWGYGFPIGGVAAFDPDQGGVVSAGGVGFDISCGVRTMLTGLKVADIIPVQKSLADSLFRQIPAGVGSRGPITLDDIDMGAMLAGGAAWAVERGWGEVRDLERIEEHGTMSGAQPANVSERARERQRREMGTLGSGNHYLEVQAVAEIFDAKVADVFELSPDDVVATIHCGSRGLGHQIGTEFLKEMLLAAKASGIELIDRELACAPINSDVGERYLGAMRAAINCALANREMLGRYARRVFTTFFPLAICGFCLTSRTTPARSKRTSSRERSANSSFTAREPPGPLDLATKAYPSRYARSVSRCSSAAVWGLEFTYWAGETTAEDKAFSSACHGAGRALSRHAALKQWSGRKIVDELAEQGIVGRESPSMRGVAEEAPGAYKDVGAVVAAAERRVLLGAWRVCDH